MGKKDLNKSNYLLSEFGLKRTKKLTEPVEIFFRHLIGKERTSGPK
jgi:hypothetical protein